MIDGGRFVLGVNYWPRSSAMAMWERFNPAEIDGDFARIAAMGLRAVRFFLRWDSFAPEPGAIDAAMLKRFERVLDIAQTHGLLTMPTLFCGHMSGVNWLPGWALDRSTTAVRFRTITASGEAPYGIGDFYADPALLDAQLHFARSVAAAARNRAAVMAWDLGNEFSNLALPRSRADAGAWSAALAGALAEGSPAPVTAGTHGEDLTEDRRLRLSSLCAPFGYATMHGYPVYSSFARRPDDPEVVPFLCDLARSFAAKPVLFTEFGNPQCPPESSNAGGFACLSEDEMAVYARSVLERLHARGALGAFWWCWTDYAKELAAEPPFDRAPHEFRFGIVRSDGSPKPVADVLSAFAGENRAVVPHTAAMQIDEEGYYADLPASTARGFTAYVAAHEERT